MKNLARIVCKIKQPRLSGLIAKIQYLNDKVFEGYFEEKLNNIFRLEEELNLIQNLAAKEFKEYKATHCPKIRTRHGLIQEIFYCQEVYLNQIENVVNFLKEQGCHNHTEKHQQEQLFALIEA